MTRFLGRLVVAAVIAILGWFLPHSPAVAASGVTDVACAHTCDASFVPAVEGGTNDERAPAACDHNATAVVIDRWSPGVSASPNANDDCGHIAVAMRAHSDNATGYPSDALTAQTNLLRVGACAFPGTSVATKGARAPAAERLFTSRAVGVDSKLFGHSYGRGESGLLNRTGSRLKFGWTSSGEFGGGWHLRLGAGRGPLNPNQARFHRDFGSTHVPNDIANDLLDFIRGLNGL